MSAATAVFTETVEHRIMSAFDQYHEADSVEARDTADALIDAAFAIAEPRCPECLSDEIRQEGNRGWRCHDCHDEFEQHA